MSTLRVNTLQNAAGTGQPAMSGAAKAWVNFNGTGTVAIRASFNVTSITDNGTGDYTVNFTNALEDANYSVVTQGTSSGKGYTVNAPKNAVSGNITTTAITMITADFNGNTSDFEYMFVAIFR